MAARKSSKGSDNAATPTPPNPPVIPTPPLPPQASDRAKDRYVSKEHPSAQFPEAADYIDSIGLDPRQIAQHGITDVGYYDLTGPVKVWRRWPHYEDGPKIIQMMESERLRRVASKA